MIVQARDGDERLTPSFQKLFFTLHGSLFEGLEAVRGEGGHRDEDAPAAIARSAAKTSQLSPAATRASLRPLALGRKVVRYLSGTRDHGIRMVDNGDLRSERSGSPAATLEGVETPRTRSGTPRRAS